MQNLDIELGLGLERDELELEAELLGEVALARHVENAGIALGLDDAVAPDLGLRQRATTSRARSTCLHRLPLSSNSSKKKTKGSIAS